MSRQWKHVECAGWAGWVQDSAEAGHLVGLLVVTCPGGGMRTWDQGPAIGETGKDEFHGVGAVEVEQKDSIAN